MRVSITQLSSMLMVDYTIARGFLKVMVMTNRAREVDRQVGPTGKGKRIVIFDLDQDIFDMITAHLDRDIEENIEEEELVYVCS